MSLSNQANATYKVSGVSLNANSNISTFDVVVPSLTIVKSNTPIIGIVGTVVSFTITITNTSLLIPCTDVILVDDLIAAGFTYVTGTAKINGVSTPNLPNTGITIGTIAPLAIVTVVFNATVN